MESKKWECCGDQGRCISANEIDTSGCSEKNTDGNCCGDETRCATAFGIDEENCNNSVERR